MNLQPNIKRFEEVKQGLITAILEDRFKPGDRLPSVRDLGLYFNVSLATVQRAIQELKDEEWVISEPSKGISVADPLPLVAHLMRVKRRGRTDAMPVHRATQGALGTGKDAPLTCLVYDELMLPLFEWAAREYAEACAPYRLQFALQPLPGHDDEEAMRNLDADLIMLPSYAAGRAARLGTITPADGMVSGIANRLRNIAPDILEMVSYKADIWGVPLMASGAILMAREAHCRRVGIDPDTLTSVEALVTAVERAVASPQNGARNLPLFNITFPITLCFMAGHGFSQTTGVIGMLRDATTHSLLERLRTLAKHPSVAARRADDWDRIDFSALALRQQPSNLFCLDPANRSGSRILPIPPAETTGAVLVTHCVCVSAKSIHPYEAWEWATHLAQTPFQQRLAALGYDIPANASPPVAEAFGKIVGTENAHRLFSLLRHPTPIYGIGPEDIMRYMWEVLANEVYRFVTGMNDYERMLERVETKTTRYLALHGAGPADEPACAAVGLDRVSMPSAEEGHEHSSTLRSAVTGARALRGGHTATAHIAESIEV